MPGELCAQSNPAASSTTPGRTGRPAGRTTSRRRARPSTRRSASRTSTPGSGVSTSTTGARRPRCAGTRGLPGRPERVRPSFEALARHMRPGEPIPPARRSSRDRAPRGSTGPRPPAVDPSGSGQGEARGGPARRAPPRLAAVPRGRRARSRRVSEVGSAAVLGAPRGPHAGAAPARGIPTYDDQARRRPAPPARRPGIPSPRAAHPTRRHHETRCSSRPRRRMESLDRRAVPPAVSEALTRARRRGAPGRHARRPAACPRRGPRRPGTRSARRSGR